MQGRQTALERGRSAVFRLASLCVLVGATAGCAVSYVDSKNVRHIIGFVDVALPATPAETSGPTPSVVSVTSFGVHAYSGTQNGSGLVVGYGKETVVTMPNNACVDLNAPGLCAAGSPTQTADGKVQ